MAAHAFDLDSLGCSTRKTPLSLRGYSNASDLLVASLSQVVRTLTKRSAHLLAASAQPLSVIPPASTQVMRVVSTLTKRSAYLLVDSPLTFSPGTRIVYLFDDTVLVQGKWYAGTAVKEAARFKDGWWLVKFDDRKIHIVHLHQKTNAQWRYLDDSDQPWYLLCVCMVVRVCENALNVFERILLFWAASSRPTEACPKTS